MFSPFLPSLPSPGQQPNEPFFDTRVLETRLSSESLEPLIGFLAYLDKNKKQKFGENSSPTKGILGHLC